MTSKVSGYAYIEHSLKYKGAQCLQERFIPMLASYAFSTGREARRQGLECVKICRCLMHVDVQSVF